MPMDLWSKQSGKLVYLSRYGDSPIIIIITLITPLPGLQSLSSFLLEVARNPSDLKNHSRKKYIVNEVATG